MSERTHERAHDDVPGPIVAWCRITGGAHGSATTEVSAGARAVKVTYPRPLIGHAQLDHPADRLYAATWDWP